ncbi:mitochondrial carrier, tricarboxylic acid Yhm2 [Schizosaccharomyces osmophilus]|uniref:Mitochondrial carrier, tricarboxylic acid Yhm2 n=1 Tax=Schizosaccharomyces osmophilus TaxID=2545709 RepID=A0AAE9W768_9SCHI|nr:mitochondrial carrier, tricarboxylic acid Yhm2 [Schizosaccharomyces osmophilus]WBW71160.1 mitochondrial carrier, tricarboxylic acid Yhm2 [Schizosaccharomyces osmophilus]
MSEIQKKQTSAANLLLGAGLNLFETSSLGHPLEVTKVQMAANRTQTMEQVLKSILSRGGILGFYQGLIPWAWIEASTKGAVLLFTSAELEYWGRRAGFSSTAAGALAGMGGGIAQAYATMGLCTCMKTAEVTRAKQAATAVSVPSTFRVFTDLYKEKGIRGINRGVNAVALRQMSNWGSRFALSRFFERPIRYLSGSKESDPLTSAQRFVASVAGGALSCWNQPVEVARVEMQSLTNGTQNSSRGIVATIRSVYDSNGIKGLYRGVVPRMGLGAYQTVVMVFLADSIRSFFNQD